MTDESVPNGPRETTEADQPSLSSQSTSTAPETRIAPQRKSPLISAIEIENFKGIGAPARIELRPITLLFGQNSAGKSTVLHALCYAHKILTHRNVDAHRTELGGDRIDLGGFRQLLHRHDADRTLRLRFELNLTGWGVPDTLWSGLFAEYADSTPVELSDYLLELPARINRGWVELQARFVAGHPRLIRYEVGAEDVLAGRIEMSAAHGTTLGFSAAHPLLDYQQSDTSSDDEGASVGTGRLGARADRVGDTADPETDGWRLSRVSLRGLTSVLPAWGQLLNIDRVESKDALDRGDPDALKAQLSALVVGIGQTLRDELARYRYVGPLRESSAPSDAASRAPHPAGWADGSAAWEHMRNTTDGAFIHRVSEWLERTDRLDTGYSLRVRSLAMVDEGTAPLLADMREYHRLRSDCGTTAASVDMDCWAHRRAERIDHALRTLLGHLTESGDDANVKALAARIKSAGDEGLPSAAGRVDAPDAAPERVLVDAARQEYRRLSDLASRMERRAFTQQEVDDLMAAVAAHPPRRELELVTTKAGLPVRISDVGVGVSQVLPIVVAALDPERPAVTGIEQPELHLHPRIQVELGEMFARCAAAGGVLLIETHSEHLLLRIMRRMRQTSDEALPDRDSPALRPDDVNVLFVEIDPHVERTLIREMPLNERGELVAAWPGGFFEESLREIF